MLAAAVLLPTALMPSAVLFPTAFMPSAGVRPSSLSPRSAMIGMADAAVLADLAALPQEQVLAGVGAIVLLGGAAVATQQKDSDSTGSMPLEVDAPTAVLEENATETPATPKVWPLVGGPGGPHPKRGPWPRDPPRQQWEPPPGWVPPTKPVSSWYDRGDRLVPPAPPPAPPAPPPPTKAPPVSTFLQQLFGGALMGSKAADSTPKEWPLVGGPGGPHPKRGPWPRDPPRELWSPPPGWVPPSKKVETVRSWYDTGIRL